MQPCSELIIFLFLRCETAAGRDVDKRDNIDTSRFYIEIGVAQVSFNQ